MYRNRCFVFCFVFCFVREITEESEKCNLMEDCTIAISGDRNFVMVLIHQLLLQALEVWQIYVVEFNFSVFFSRSSIRHLSELRTNRKQIHREHSIRKIRPRVGTRRRIRRWIPGRKLPRHPTHRSWTRSARSSSRILQLSGMEVHILRGNPRFIHLGIRIIPLDIRFIPVGIPIIPLGIRIIPLGIRIIPLGIQIIPLGIRFIPLGIRLIPQFNPLLILLSTRWFILLDIPQTWKRSTTVSSGTIKTITTTRTVTTTTMMITLAKNTP